MNLDEHLDLERLAPEHWHSLPDARRADAEQLLRQIRMVSQSPVVTALLEAVDAVLVVLNAQRQIVAMNGQGARIRQPSEVMGLRPGEALSCVNAQGPGGCGAAPACETCGALGAILGCRRNGGPTEAECLVRSELGAGISLEFNVRASPLVIDGCSFTVVSLRDVSSEKRRQALEQIFFHDVLNTVAGLRGWATLLKRPKADHARAGERIDLLSRHLEREIRDHRALLDAESGTLVPDRARVRAEELLRDLEAIFSQHVAAADNRLEIERVSPELELETDSALLLRVLVNMVRNALEATPPGSAARVRCEQLRPEPSGEESDPGAVRFSVRNEGVIPPGVQARIFQRSFSTKAQRGRGLGTYGMKLLGERYLAGEVSFVSAPESGTIFWIDLPLGTPPAGFAASN